MNCASWVDMAWEKGISQVSLPLAKAEAKNGSAPEDSPSEHPAGALPSPKEKRRMLNRIADVNPGSWVLLDWKQPSRYEDQ